MVDRGLRIAILGDSKDVHVRRWCAGLAARGLEIWNICNPLPAEPQRGLGYLEFRVPDFDLRRPHRRPVRFRRYFQELFRRFDLIHMHNLHNWGLDESMTACGRLIVSTYGSDVLPAHLPPQGRKPVVDQNEHTAGMKQQALVLADHITATSAFLAEAASDYADIPRNQIEVIHFGTDTDLFLPQRVGRTPPGRVGYCGGFRPNKGADIFIEAAPLVCKRFPSCVFDLYGTGYCRTQLEALVKNRGQQHAIRFHDFVPHDRLPETIDIFDLLAVPSVCAQESYCVMAVEAQAMEVPVVASRIGGLPDTIRHGRTGLLVEPASPQALADGLCELLGDEEKRRSLGRAARQWVKARHSWSDSLDRMIAAYGRVMSGYSRRKMAETIAPGRDCTPTERVPAQTARG